MRRLALVVFLCLTLPPARARAADPRVSMVEVRFQPPEVRVPVGGTVTWSNEDTIALAHGNERRAGV